MQLTYKEDIFRTKTYNGRIRVNFSAADCDYRLLYIVCWSFWNFSVANSVDLDQTAPRGAVWSGATLLICMLQLVLDVSIYML